MHKCCFIYFSFIVCSEFDKFLEEHKQELSAASLDEGDAAKQQENEYEIEQADQQVKLYAMAVTSHNKLMANSMS